MKDEFPALLIFDFLENSHSLRHLVVKDYATAIYLDYLMIICLE